MPDYKITPEWLAGFCRREKNSLHYRPASDRDRPGNAYLSGYSTAIDGMIARLARELRETGGEARFLAELAKEST